MAPKRTDLDPVSHDELTGTGVKLRKGISPEERQGDALSRYTEVPNRCMLLYSTEDEVLDEYIKRHWAALDGLSGDFCDVYVSLWQLNGNEDFYAFQNKISNIPGASTVSETSLPAALIWSDDAYMVIQLGDVANHQVMLRSFFRSLFGKLAEINRPISFADQGLFNAAFFEFRTLGHPLNETISMMQDTNTKDIVVILVHGIRTSGWWQSKVATIFSKVPSVEVIPLKFGYFDLFSFLLPIQSLKLRPIETLRREVQEVSELNKNKNIMVFAHSFGTYAVTKILSENRNIKIDKLILCGSIVPEDFDWLRVGGQIRATSKRNAIVNDCGTRDIWPILAKSITWGYGSTGTFGAGRSSLTDRYHDFGHSGFFSDKFIEKYWVPILQGKELVPSPTDKLGSKNPWYFPFLRFPWRYAIFLTPVFVFLMFQPNNVSCSFDQDKIDGKCVAKQVSTNAQDEQVKNLRVLISEIIQEVNKTLNQKNAALFPAFQEFFQDPSEIKWREIQNSANQLLLQVQQGIRMVEDYDSRLIATDGGILLVSNGIKQLVDRQYINGFISTKKEWNGRANVTKKIVKQKEIPTIVQAKKWETEFRTLHSQLTDELKRILRLLDQA